MISSTRNYTVAIYQNETLPSPLSEQWEGLVQRQPASGFMQSLPWAAVKRLQGNDSFHVLVSEGDTVVGGAIFYSAQRRNGLGLCVAPEGPVLPWADEIQAAKILGAIIEKMSASASALGIMGLRIEPRLPPPPAPLLREFVRAPVDLVPRETLYIDIAPSAEEQLLAMKPKGRYNIGLAERAGVKVSIDLSGDSVSRFHSVLCEASSRDGFAIESLQFFEQIASVLVPSGNASFLFAEHDSDTLGTALLIKYGSRATYLYGGITNSKRNLMAGYALQWAAMQEARRCGCTLYDFYGYDRFRSPEHRYARFSQFKSRFGGVPVRFIGGQDYFL
ncbi:MAG TPA: peptidoglycan bridge formation glycyltransferase FemA/FemB family protein, partial [Chroococcales cyanobacterium]